MKNNKISFAVFSFIISMVISQFSLAKPKDIDFITDYESPVPKFKEFNLDPKTIESLVGDKQLILTHPKRSIKAPGKKGIREFEDVMFVTSVMRIDRPINEVRNVVLDYGKYKDFVPHTESSEVLRQTDTMAIVQSEVEFDTPIGNIKETIALQYTEEKDGDISIIMRKGAVDASLSRWEFIDLGNSKTLAIYTNWIDLASSGFIIKVILKSDPDLKKAAPIAIGAVVIEEFKKRVEGEAPRPEVADMPSAPVMPTFAHGKDVSIETLTNLSNIGTLLFVHKAQWINHPKEGVMEFIYVTAGSVISAPVEPVINQSIQFDRYREFFHHIRDNETISENNDLRNEPFDVKWRLKVGLGIMKIKIKYEMHYEWIAKNVLEFNRTKGDIGHVNGVWEYIPVGSDKTLMVITAVSKVGEEGSFILKLSNKIPNLEMISTIIAQALIVEKQKPWIESELNPVKEKRTSTW